MLKPLYFQLISPFAFAIGSLIILSLIWSVNLSDKHCILWSNKVCLLKVFRYWKCLLSAGFYWMMKEYVFNSNNPYFTFESVKSNYLNSGAQNIPIWRI
jgi:hypothetical protein